MSYSTIKTEIKRFLNSSIPEVLAIKGRWGVGKTFTWNLLLKEAKDSNALKLEEYSYVSLFGINSLDALKTEIFIQGIDRGSIGTKPSIDTFNLKFEAQFKSFSKRALHIASKFPFLNKYIAPNLIESLSFFSIKNSLIVIDDFEKKDDSITSNQIMGLASQLKEQRDCKIVFIFNEEALKGDFEEDYNELREKVIDIEITFNPTAEECATLVFPKNDTTSSNLKKFIATLGINNIRVIKRIASLWDKLSPHLSEYDEEVTYQSCHSLTLFVWSFYRSGSEEIPELNFIKRLGTQSYVRSEIDDSRSKEEKWMDVLRQYEFWNPNKLDLVIADFVEAGWLDEMAINLQAQKLHDEILAKKSEDSFSQSWDFYRDSFDDNQEEVVNTMYDQFKENAEHISVINLSITVNLFRQLGRDDWADEIISFYIDKNKNLNKVFDLSENVFRGDITDSKLIESFKVQYESSIEKETIKEVLSKINQQSGGWSPSDEVILSEGSEEDYYQLFKSERGEELHSYIKTCLSFRSFSSPSENKQKIVNTVIKVLKKIGSESKINAVRIKRYGIILDKEENKTD